MFRFKGFELYLNLGRISHLQNRNLDYFNNQGIQLPLVLIFIVFFIVSKRKSNLIFRTSSGSRSRSARGGCQGTLTESQKKQAQRVSHMGPHRDGAIYRIFQFRPLPISKLEVVLIAAQQLR